MTMNDQDYYRRRERQERALAASISDRDIAAIHARMAQGYAQLLSREMPTPSRRDDVA